MNQLDILHGPFDIDTYKENFTNYLEVIIDEDGKVLYAVPSHQEKLISISCKKLGVTRDELNDMCPPEYYLDFMTWLCQVSKCVAVWNNMTAGEFNSKQVDAIYELMVSGLYYGGAPKKG